MGGQTEKRRPRKGEGPTTVFTGAPAWRWEETSEHFECGGDTMESKKKGGHPEVNSKRKGKGRQKKKKEGQFTCFVKLGKNHY